MITKDNFCDLLEAMEYREKITGVRRLMKLKKMMTQEKFLKYQKNCNL